MGIRIEGEPNEELDEADPNTAQTAERELTDAELDGAGDTAVDGASDTEHDETLITIGEPPAEASAASDESQQPAPAWAKELRKDYRRVQRELAEERRKHAAVQPTGVESALAKLKEPTLEECGWDEAEFRKRTAAWVKEQGEIERRQEQQAEAVRKQQETARATQAAYRTAASALKMPDFEEAEDTVVGALSEVQQNILLAGCDNAALVVYALGKNPTKAAELAKIADPVKFAFAAAKLEKEIKVTPRKTTTKPAPEQIPTRTASLSGGGNTALDAARKKAEQSGDYTEVNRIRRQLRASARK